MVACCWCHLVAIDMSPSTCTAKFSHFWAHGLSKVSDFRHAQVVFGSGHDGLVLQKKQLRRLKFVVAAELPRRSFSLDFGFDLDSQTFQPLDVSQLRWIGPVPGDIAEVEAYCRIFRAAEHLHTTLMDTLCDPVTGVCTVSYDFPLEMLEDKLVSVLGCMISLLDKGRQDVLSGRSSIMASFQVEEVSAIEDRLPPLAIFRSEIKRCCESLHVALENYLTPGDGRSNDIWRKLQRLKNVCYDLGFPREEDSPSHTLFANWAGVSISTSKEDTSSADSDVVFWKGGQVTEEGLKWLMDRGFRTIVDLRAETVKDKFYQVALDDALGSGKVELFKFPVDIGTAPSKEQVEKFAALVSDPNRRPLYLHSKEGVWRTSAMVSRWRQFVVRHQSQLASNSSIPSFGALGWGIRKLSGDAISTLSTEENLVDGDSLLQNTMNDMSTPNGLLSNQASVIIEEHDQEINRACGVGLIHGEFVPLTETLDSMFLSAFSTEIVPFKLQIPPRDVFSRKEMSNFLRNRNISPSTFARSVRKSAWSVPAARESCTRTSEKVDYVRKDSVSVLMKTGSSNESSLNKDNSVLGQQSTTENGVTLDYRNDISNGAAVGGGRPQIIANGHSALVTDKMPSKEDVSATIGSDQKNNGHLSIVPGDNGIEVIEGNMCASTTGVVRVQSRKKAEMFIVRTDGFSCTREKVTESSLAFSHPTTQQQMLMWKSTPKTVLLLKKLGPELMEEAKEVASFLYYQEKMDVLVEPDVHDVFARIPGFGFVQTFYAYDTSDLHEKVDFVVCLGGDGVILHASNLFGGAVPPVVSFNLGSLGFLTSHNFVHDQQLILVMFMQFEGYKKDLRQVIHGNNTREGVYITLRMRLRCEVFRNGKPMPVKVFDVLNEVVVDRGSNPYLSKIECYEHERLITKVQGDGIIVATPTGSTAYSTSAGGSMLSRFTLTIGSMSSSRNSRVPGESTMGSVESWTWSLQSTSLDLFSSPASEMRHSCCINVHPNVPCMLFTPICPHSLSFRPVILPDSAWLELKIPEDARSNAWVSFDGKRRQQLSRGDSVRISMSQHPLPTVDKSDQTGDWFHSLIRCLNWNERMDQKAL
ncbi:hypothetical protein Cgig2_004784 [Carnegiea gigantea]|uniref:DSP-PTPase phosphatase fused to NAD+ Kinase domain-containing protein n=1 Tax=Carnegiea gigantea TaxID=171969 RepID=A0A9Q1QQ06_9CARY|nr:hypothetical protein Cgig2_004784 [Carnegiea gigantea]